MKNKTTIGLLVLGSLMVAAPAFAAPFDTWITHTDETGTATSTVPLALPGDGLHGVFGVDALTHLPVMFELGDGFDVSSNSLSINLEPGNIGLGELNNTSDLDKPISTATQAALDELASSTQRIRVETDSSGSYTWTFPEEFASTPVVQVTPQDSSTTALVNAYVTSVSPTSVTIQTQKTNVVSVLGVSVLQMISSPQLYVNITAVAQ